MLLKVAIKPPMSAPCAAPLAVAAATSTCGGCRRIHSSTWRFFSSTKFIAAEGTCLARKVTMT